MAELLSTKINGTLNVNDYFNIDENGNLTLNSGNNEIFKVGNDGLNLTGNLTVKNGTAFLSTIDTIDDNGVVNVQKPMNITGTLTTSGLITANGGLNVNTKANINSPLNIGYNDNISVAIDNMNGHAIFNMQKYTWINTIKPINSLTDYVIPNNSFIITQEQYEQYKNKLANGNSLKINDGLYKIKSSGICYKKYYLKDVTYNIKSTLDIHLADGGITGAIEPIDWHLSLTNVLSTKVDGLSFSSTSSKFTFDASDPSFTIKGSSATALITDIYNNFIIYLNSNFLKEKIGSSAAYVKDKNGILQSLSENENIAISTFSDGFEKIAFFLLNAEMKIVPIPSIDGKTEITESMKKTSTLTKNLNELNYTESQIYYYITLASEFTPSNDDVVAFKSTIENPLMINFIDETTNSTENILNIDSEKNINLTNKVRFFNNNSDNNTYWEIKVGDTTTNSDLYIGNNSSNNYSIILKNPLYINDANNNYKVCTSNLYITHITIKSTNQNATEKYFFEMDYLDTDYIYYYNNAFKKRNVSNEIILRDTTASGVYINSSKTYTINKFYYDTNTGYRFQYLDGISSYSVDIPSDSTVNCNYKKIF